MVMGHELGGEVVAVGAGVKEHLVGSTVAVLPVISCGSCPACAAGTVAHCAQTRYLGMGPDRGGFAEFAAVPARHSFVLPNGLPAAYAALVEPFAVGLHGVHTAALTEGESVLVVGAGGVGLTTTAWARVTGAQRITVVDPDARRRDSAMAMGATDVAASASDVEPGAYDAAIECVGRPELLQAVRLRCARSAHRHLRSVRPTHADRTHHRTAQGADYQILGLLLAGNSARPSPPSPTARSIRHP